MQEKKKHNIPPLRFAEFSEEWQEKKLGECVAIERGERVVKNELIENGVYPVISGGISPLGFLDVFNRNANTITIAQYGTAGFVNLQSQNFWANDVCYSLYPQEIVTDFLYPFLKGQQEYIYTLNTTAIPAHLPQERLEELSISFPSLKEQEQIGEFFRALDELIGAKEEELEKLRQMKAALLEAMFPIEEGQISVNGGGYKYIDVKLLSEDLCLSAGSADTPLLRFRGFTEPWQRKKLGELFTLRNGYTPSKDNPRYWEKGTISWFRMEDIREQGHILKEAIQKVTPEAVKGGGLFSADSFILATTATIGEHAWIIADSLANQQFTVLSTVNRWETLHKWYFHQYCFLLGEWCRRNVNVGGLNAVNIADLINHQIPFPSLAEQERIGEFFRSQDEGIAAVGEQVERLRAMKQAFLERMFA